MVIIMAKEKKHEHGERHEHSEKQSGKNITAEELEKAAQAKYFEAEIYKSQLNAMLKEEAAIDERLAELVQTLISLDNLKKSEPGKQAWCATGSGTFVKTVVSDSESVLVSVGAGIAVEKPIDDAKLLLNERINDMEKAKQEMLKEIESFTKHLERTEAELKILVSQMK